MRTISKLWRNQRGQALAEYGLILALVAVIAMAALTLLGHGARTDANEIASIVNTDS